MKFTFDLSGNGIPLIKEYDIDSEIAIGDGEVVGLAGSKVVKADDAECILGVAAEEHTGTHDELNARSDGTKIRVIISPDAVYGAAAKAYIASTGNETTIVVPSDGLSVGVNSGYAVLVRKAENSLNTDEIGTKRKISECTIAGNGAALTVEAGSAPSNGDVYILIPEIAGEMQLDSTGLGVCFFRQDSGCKFKTVAVSDDYKTIYVKINGSVFA